MEQIDRRELKYERALDKKIFAARIDATGGWPLGYSHVSFLHGPDDNWWCTFTDGRAHNEWWSVVMSADEYYWIKISDAKKAEIRKDARLEFAREVSRAAHW
jgi:hypothetical protein